MPGPNAVWAAVSAELRLPFREGALCAQTDPELFFPETGGSIAAARRICRRCEVTAECLEYALTHDERFGVWGGKSERERRQLRGDREPVDVLLSTRDKPSRTF